jgi:hypothetical protein
MADGESWKRPEHWFLGKYWTGRSASDSERVASSQWANGNGRPQASRSNQTRCARKGGESEEAEIYIPKDSRMLDCIDLRGRTWRVPYSNSTGFDYWTRRGREPARWRYE